MYYRIAKSAILILCGMEVFYNIDRHVIIYFIKQTVSICFSVSCAVNNIINVGV